MDYFFPMVQAVVTTSVGVCLGWFFCKRPIFHGPKPLNFDNVSGNVKLVLVARTDLGMGKGKMAAQV